MGFPLNKFLISDGASNLRLLLYLAYVDDYGYIWHVKFFYPGLFFYACTKSPNPKKPRSPPHHKTQSPSIGNSNPKTQFKTPTP